jgi:allantoicase
MLGSGMGMGDGWETRRRCEPGYDWAIFKLGHAGTLARLEIDTAHFKGNYPHQCSVQAAYAPNAAPASLASRSIYWQTLLAPKDMSADVIESFSYLAELGVVSHLRLNMHPDDGVSRLRAFGLPGDQ